MAEEPVAIPEKPTSPVSEAPTMLAENGFASPTMTEELKAEAFQNGGGTCGHFKHQVN